jgi:hypothetical protein
MNDDPVTPAAWKFRSANYYFAAAAALQIFCLTERGFAHKVLNIYFLLNN